MARILIVEAEADGAELAALICRASGHRVTVALDGEVAWGLLQSRPYDMVLMDLRLPKVDGLALARRLRASERHTGIGIAVVTARVTGVDRTHLAELDVHEVVMRPYDAATLRRGVAAALGEAPTGIRVELIRVWARGRIELRA